MAITLVKFITCAGVIFFAGKRVALYADAIADKTGLSRLWIGVILVSLATSLPELFTGIGSVAFLDAPNITVGNLFGANSYNLLNIAVIDLLSRGGPILSIISSGQLLTAALSLIPLTLAAVGIAASSGGIRFFSVLNVGVFSIAVFLSYCVAARVIYNFEKRNNTATNAGTKYEGVSLKKAWTFFAMAAAAIIASGIWLAYIGKELSEVLNLDQSFVGSLFLGLTTTLPEITVSIAALLIGAKEIAVANMLGSNLFNMTIIFVDDIFYRKAPILQAVSPKHIHQAAVVMAMTAVIILAIAIKRKRKFLGISWYVPALFIIFLIGAYVNFQGR
jgi:cation:H+ antiporter